MNAIDPAKPTVRNPPLWSGSDLPPHAQADRWFRLMCWLTAAIGSAALALAGIWIWAASLPAIPLLAALRHTALPRVGMTSLLLAFAGCLATGVMTWARRRATAEPSKPPPRWRRMLSLGPTGQPAMVGGTARWPQAVTIMGLSAVVLSIAGNPLATQGLSVAPAKGILLGAACLVVAFPLLVTERWLASVPAAQLPEAPALRTLLLLPVLAWPVAGLAQIAAALGAPATTLIDSGILILVILVAAELGLRAMGRCFLPPPAPANAVAAVESVVARIIADGLGSRSLAEPVRQHLGIDFSRSWALAYLRAAMLPVVLLLLLMVWGLTGIILINPDQRAVYERFGAPVAVLHPGAHLILPWPMGQVRRLEYGTIHETTLSGADMNQTIQRVGAEDTPPPEADRLWEQAHPAELIFLIASGTAERQNFQAVSADFKLRYRIGLTDQDALQAAYGSADPVALLRASAGRVVAAFFAGQTLDRVLGENREEIADRLGVALQRDLDRSGAGIQVAAVVIEAIHPPAGAAEAYHNVQAAEIRANTSIEAERGRAKSTQANASQYATDVVAQAQAAAAETTSTAQSDLTRFTADHAAVSANSDAFLLERRLTAIGNGLAKSALTIVDHRIPPPEAPVLDLRPLSPTTARSAGTDRE